MSASRLKPPLIAALALFALLLAGCGGGSASPPSLSPTPGLMHEFTRERAGVRMSLTVDQEVYRPGQPVKVKATVENDGDGPLAYSLRQEGDPPIYLWLISDLNGEEPLTEPGRIQGPQAEGLGGVLAVGERITREVEWDQRLSLYRTPVQAPPGVYTLRAQFLTLDGETVPHTVSVTFRIEGSEPVITPREAIEAAVRMPEVQEWLRERGTSLICALPEGPFYNVNIEKGEAYEAIDLLYRSQVEAGLPICSPVTEEDSWRVLFLAAKGPAPKRISAFVDLHDGTPLRVEEGGLKPLVTPTPEGTASAGP